MPACATAALALLAILQLGWSRPIPLPLPEPVAPVRLTPLSLPRIGLPARGTRTLFDARAGGTSGPIAALPLEGARVAGIARQGGRATLFLQAADGRVVRLSAGQSFAGWQLVAIGRAEVRFRRGGESVTLPIDGGAAPPASRSEVAQQ